MRVYTYSQARQNLASLLNEALLDKKVIIKRKDGNMFSLTPEEMPVSPFDIKGMDTDISTEEMISFIHESREDEDI